MRLPVLVGLTVVIAFYLGTARSQAEDQDHFKKLLETNSCYNCDLSYADLSNKLLVDANLDKATLNHANLTNANLTGAKLRGADLRNAQLEKAILAPMPFTLAGF